MVKTVAIVQARMASTRLPGKVMLNICGKPVLLHLIDRLKVCKFLDNIVVATTINTRDDIIFDLVKNYDMKVGLFRGSEENVLERYYFAAKKFTADIVVRVTSDDPLIDPKVLDLLIKTFLDSNCDYCCNNMPPSFPLGLDAEVFSFEALENVWKEAKIAYEKEHVTEYIRNNSDKFSLINVRNDTNLSNLRWTLDYPEDFTFINEIYMRLYHIKKIFYMNDILELLNNEPDLTEINKKYVMSQL